MAKLPPPERFRGEPGETREHAVPCQNCFRRSTFHKTARCRLCRTWFGLDTGDQAEDDHRRAENHREHERERFA